MLNVIIYTSFNTSFLTMKAKFNSLKPFLKLKNYILHIPHFISVRCLHFHPNSAIGAWAKGRWYEVMEHLPIFIESWFKNSYTTSPPNTNWVPPKLMSRTIKSTCKTKCVSLFQVSLSCFKKRLFFSTC